MGDPSKETSAEGVFLTSRFDKNMIWPMISYVVNIESESKPSIDIWFIDAKATRHDVSVFRKSGRSSSVDCVLGPQVTWQPIWMDVDAFIIWTPNKMYPCIVFLCS